MLAHMIKCYKDIPTAPAMFVLFPVCKKTLQILPPTPSLFCDSPQSLQADPTAIPTHKS